MKMEWSNKMGPRERKAWLLLVKEEKVLRFVGESIPGVIVVVGTSYTKNGKWSHTTYRLETGDGVRAIAGMDGWETGRFKEGLASAVGAPVDRWSDVAKALKVSRDVAMEFLRGWKPKAAEAFDKVESDLAAL